MLTKPANNSQKDSKKLFFDTRATKNKPLPCTKHSYVYDHSKTVFKKLATAYTTNENSQFTTTHKKTAQKLNLRRHSE